MIYSILCVVNFLVVLLGWQSLITIVLRTVIGHKKYEDLKKKVFAHWFSKYCADDLSKAFQSAKAEIFADLKKEKSADPELAKKNALNILEVGVGSGTNLEFYPAGSRLVCVDPNGKFETYFRRECERKASHLDPDIRFVVERGEWMPSVADGSVDAVVITLVLCGVELADEALQEVRRVLKPGGKLYFLEHVGHPAGTWRLQLQRVLTDCGLWTTIFDGCRLDKDVAAIIQNAGFSHVDLQRRRLVGGKLLPATVPPSGLAFFSPVIYGVATN